MINGSIAANKMSPNENLLPEFGSVLVLLLGELETEQMPELTVTPHLEGSSIACVTLMLLEAVLLLIKLQRHFGLDLITDVSGSQQSLDGRPLVKLR